MIKGTKNQLANVGNRYQTKAWKALCVCSAGMLRSPTLANILHQQLGYNTRAVGADKGFALIPISQALIWWADEIIFVNRESFEMLDDEEKQEIEDVGVKVTILKIEDDYDWNDESLKQTIITQFLN